MADEKGRNQDDFGRDELAGKIDPADPEARMLRGLLGPSTRDTHHRLYLSTALNRFIEWPKKDTIHVRRLETGEAAVWVKRTTEITETRIGSGPLQLLEGEIAQAYALRKPLNDFPAAACCSTKNPPPATDPLSPQCYTVAQPNCPTQDFHCPYGGGGGFPA
jgi:hypothetical protein